MQLLDYSGSEGDKYHRDRHSEIFKNKGLLDAWGHYAEEIYLADVAPGGKVLEVGAGTGINLVQAVQRFEVFAVEPSAYAREHCATLGIKVVASTDDLPAGLLFDKILIRHVLEHVQEPRAFLLSLSKLLAPSGSITIVVPSESPFVDVDPNDINFHLYCWNRQSLWNLVLDAGLKPRHAILNWYNGRRLFVPLLKLFGVGAYIGSLRALGRIRRASEIIVVASKA